MIIHKEGRRVFTFGENLADVEHWLRASPRNWTIEQSRTNAARNSWDMSVGYDGALRLAKEGWSEGARDLSDKLSVYMPCRDKEDSWHYDVAGELPDIGRFLAGDPAHMRRHGHPKGHRPIISLAVNIAVNGSVTASNMANYGTALLAVIDRIENAGRRVDLSTIMVAQQGNVRNIIGWRVKEADQPCDLAAIAFSIGHPAALRRLGFAMYEHSDSPTCYGYGYQTKATEEDVPDPAPNTLVIPGLGFGGASTLDAAIALVRKQVNEAAGEELVTLV